MSSALDITESVNPPRAALLDFPLGHTAGKPDDPALQRAILLEALRVFAEPAAPGVVRRLPFRWSEDESWKVEVERGPDVRRRRTEEPQYQHERDRELAESSGEGTPGPSRTRSGG